MIDTRTSLNHTQFYAQLVHLVNSGQCYWLNDEDEALVKQKDVSFEVVEILDPLFLSAFDRVEESNGIGEWLCTTKIMATILLQLGFNSRRDNDLLQMGCILKNFRYQSDDVHDVWNIW